MWSVDIFPFRRVVAFVVFLSRLQLCVTDSFDQILSMSTKDMFLS